MKGWARQQQWLFCSYFDLIFFIGQTNKRDPGSAGSLLDLSPLRKPVLIILFVHILLNYQCVHFYLCQSYFLIS